MYGLLDEATVDAPCETRSAAQSLVWVIQVGAASWPESGWVAPRLPDLSRHGRAESHRHGMRAQSSIRAQVDDSAEGAEGGQ